jgi:hypothetical protein
VFQDHRGEDVLIAVVADGAGSAPRAETGSLLACAVVGDEIRALLMAGGSLGDVTRDFVAALIGRFQAEVSACAATDGARSRDFACTIVAAVVGVDRAVFFQVGDGAIVVSGPEEQEHYSCIFWPDTGEYENVTFFATDADAVDHLGWALAERAIDEVALFSDGLERLALHYASRQAYAPFFRGMLAILSGPAISREALSAGLVDLLSSAAVRERTDDDTTLILATRREPMPPPRGEDGESGGL